MFERGHRLAYVQEDQIQCTENVGRIRVIIGIVDGVHARGTVEECGCEEVRVAQAPGGSARRVVPRGQLPNLLRCLRVPAENTVILTAVPGPACTTRARAPSSCYQST